MAKTIGILTGGGDVPGLNTCIKAIALRATEYGDRVVGIRRGWGGLVQYDPSDAETAASCILALTPDIVLTIDRSGGTFLHSSRVNPAQMPTTEVPPALKASFASDAPFVT
jgi:6-phosphofructokinase 1